MEYLVQRDEKVIFNFINLFSKWDILLRTYYPIVQDGYLL